MGIYFADELLASLNISTGSSNSKKARAERNKKYSRKVYSPAKREEKNWDLLFPEYRINPNEDLNLERMYIVYLRLFWSDLETYPTIETIAKKMNLKPRKVFTLSKKYKFKQNRNFKY